MAASDGVFGFGMYTMSGTWARCAPVSPAPNPANDLAARLGADLVGGVNVTFPGRAWAASSTSCGDALLALFERARRRARRRAAREAATSAVSADAKAANRPIACVPVATGVVYHTLRGRRARAVRRRGREMRAKRTAWYAALRPNGRLAIHRHANLVRNSGETATVSTVERGPVRRRAPPARPSRARSS